MRALDGAVRKAGLTFLNEVGLDPGIDHMSALRIIHGIEGRGGTVTSFHSYCGALPAPEADTNPWGYKFSWSPRGVIVAGRNSARYLEDGEEKTLPGERLFSRHWLVEVKGFGEFEAYYNRDSIPYVEAYGLTGVRDMFRATLRYPGWSYTMQKLADLSYFGLDDLTPPPATYADLAAALAQVPAGGDLAARVAEVLDVDRASDTITRMEWLGLFADEPIPWDDLPTRSPLDALASRMLALMPLEKGERDLCVMQHEIAGEYPSGTRETVTSTLVAFGEPRRRFGHRADRRPAGRHRRDDGPRRAHRRPGRPRPRPAQHLRADPRRARRVGGRGVQREDQRGVTRSGALPPAPSGARWRGDTIFCRSRGGPRAAVGRSQVVRHRVLVPASGGSNPPAPATSSATRHRATTQVDT